MLFKTIFFDCFHKELKSEHFFYMLFYFLWSSVLYSYFLGALNSVPFVSSFKENISIVIFCTLILGAIPYLLKRLNFIYICMYVCLVIAYQICFSLFPENEYYLQSEQFRFLCLAFPYFFLGICFKNSKKNMTILNVISILSIWCDFVYFVILRKGNMTAAWSENMVGSYNLLPCVMFITISFFREKTCFKLLSLIVGLLLVCSYGTRGPVIAFVFLYLLLFFFDGEKGGWNKKVTMLFLLFVLYVLFQHFSEMLISFVGNVGLSTRFFYSFLYADKIDTSGRDFLYDIVLSHIEFFNIHGFAGDRLLLKGSYAHNFFLEMWYSFGIFGGTLLILGIFIMIFTALFFSKNGDLQLLLVLVSFVFVHLMFSGSFLHQGWLYFLIGYSINVITKARCKCVLKK